MSKLRIIALVPMMLVAILSGIVCAEGMYVVGITLCAIAATTNFCIASNA